MFRVVVIAGGVLLVALLVFAGTKPDTFRVQRSTVIKAPPESVFGTIDDFHRWGSWSPWEQLDPPMKRNFLGAARGKGAVYEWDGNMNVGKGRVEITGSAPPRKVTMQLDYVRPFECHNVVEFTLEARADTTTVTWAMKGPNTYLAKVMSVFFGDGLVGGQFEKGLANLKAVTEM